MQVDGREVFFPRVGEGFGRAEHENYWLESGGAGFVVVNNAGFNGSIIKYGRNFFLK